MSTTLYPKSQPQFVMWLDNLARKLALDPGAYGATEAQSARVSAANAALQSAYAIAVQPATRTQSAVAGKDFALAVARREAKNIADIVRASPTITPSELAELGIPPRATRTRSEPPAEMVRLGIVSTGPHSVRVRLYDGLSLRPKCDGAIGCVLMSYVGETPPAKLSAWSLAGLTSKSTFEVEFPSDLPPGSKVWITARFVNRKLQQGPPAEPPVQLRLAGHLGSAMAEMKLAA